MTTQSVPPLADDDTYARMRATEHLLVTLPPLLDDTPAEVVDAFAGYERAHEAWVQAEVDVELAASQVDVAHTREGEAIAAAVRSGQNPRDGLGAVADAEQETRLAEHVRAARLGDLRAAAGRLIEVGLRHRDQVEAQLQPSIRVAADHLAAALAAVAQARGELDHAAGCGVWWQALAQTNLPSYTGGATRASLTALSAEAAEVADRAALVNVLPPAAAREREVTRAEAENHARARRRAEAERTA